MPLRRFAVADKGKAPSEGVAAPTTKSGRGRHRKYTATPAVASDGHDSGSACPGITIGSHGRALTGAGDRGGRNGRSVMATRPSCPRLHSADTTMEFMTWVDMMEIASLQLASFFAKALPVGGLSGLWLQDDGYCGWAS